MGENIKLNSKTKVKPSFQAFLDTPDVTYKNLNSKQGFEIAVLCFEGRLVDVGVHNLDFTQDGKIAIVDTEPATRHLIKGLKKSCLGYVPNSVSTIKFLIAMKNSERAYLLCDNGEGLRIRQVQKKMFRKHMNKLLAHMVLPIIFSVGALVGSIFLANPIFIGLAGVAVLISSINAIANLVLSLYTIQQYNHYKSLYGHLEP